MTGLVYLAIIALWVMFLIPWLGRHRDEHNGRRTADRYHRAMDTLARAGHTIRHPRQDAQDLDELEDADLSDTAQGAAPGLGLPNIGESWRALAAAINPSVADRRSAAARRRRRVLLVLSIGLLGTIAGGMAGVLPISVVVLPAGLLAAYVLLLTRQARAGLGAAGSAGSAQADRYREATRRAQAQARGLLAPKQQADAATTGWDAVPATLPTYVTKPKASKVPRVVDLTAPGRGWTGEEMVQRAQQERSRARVVAQEQFEREMAALQPDPVVEVAELANPAEPSAPHRQTYRRAANG